MLYPPIEVRCVADRPCEHVLALTAAGQQALHETMCPEQGWALLEHARRLAEIHRDENLLREAG